MLERRHAWWGTGRELEAQGGKEGCLHVRVRMQSACMCEGVSTCLRAPPGSALEGGPCTVPSHFKNRVVVILVTRDLHDAGGTWGGRLGCPGRHTLQVCWPLHRVLHVSRRTCRGGPLPAAPTHSTRLTGRELLYG